jgi:hypothetical protein
MAPPPLFVDGSVLLASGRRDGARQARAREWLTLCWQSRCRQNSSQVLNGCTTRHCLLQAATCTWCAQVCRLGVAAALDAP